MSFDKKQIKGVADLAKLNLDTAKQEGIAKDLTSILGYVEELQSIDIANVADVGQITNLTNQLAPDEITEEFKREELLANLPAARQTNGFVKVKSVLGRKT